MDNLKCSKCSFTGSYSEVNSHISAMVAWRNGSHIRMRSDGEVLADARPVEVPSGAGGSTTTPITGTASQGISPWELDRLREGGNPGTLKYPDPTSTPYESNRVPRGAGGSTTTPITGTASQGISPWEIDRQREGGKPGTLDYLDPEEETGGGAPVPSTGGAPTGWSESMYLNANPDVATAVANGTMPSALYHYNNYGKSEGRQGNFIPKGWHEQTYLEKNPDVAAAVGRGEMSSGLSHYLNYGGAEGRKGDFAPAGFNENDYLSLHPDVAQAVQNGTMPSGLHHYLNYGKSEGRQYAVSKTETTPATTPSPAPTPGGGSTGGSGSAGSGGGSSSDRSPKKDKRPDKDKNEQGKLKDIHEEMLSLGLGFTPEGAIDFSNTKGADPDEVARLHRRYDRLSDTEKQILAATWDPDIDVSSMSEEVQAAAGAISASEGGGVGSSGLDEGPGKSDEARSNETPGKGGGEPDARVLTVGNTTAQNAGSDSNKHTKVVREGGEVDVDHNENSSAGGDRIPSFTDSLTSSATAVASQASGETLAAQTSGGEKIYVAKGGSVTKMIQDIAAEGGQQISGKEAWKIYESMKDDLSNMDNTYTMQNGHVGLSKPGEMRIDSGIVSKIRDLSNGEGALSAARIEGSNNMPSTLGQGSDAMGLASGSQVRSNSAGSAGIPTMP